MKSLSTLYPSCGCYPKKIEIENMYKACLISTIVVSIQKANLPDSRYCFIPIVIDLAVNMGTTS